MKKKYILKETDKWSEIYYSHGTTIDLVHENLNIMTIEFLFYKINMTVFNFSITLKIFLLFIGKYKIT